MSAIFTSNDGASWSDHSLPGEPRDLRVVQPSSTGWVAAGPGGLLVSSLDGGSWTRRYAPNLELSAAVADGTDVLVGGEKGLILRVTP